MFSICLSIFYSALLIVGISSLSLAQNIDSSDGSVHPDPLDLGNPEFSVREAATESWKKWISKNPQNSLNALKIVYVTHQANPEIRSRITSLIKQVMTQNLKKVRLGISFKEKSTKLKNGLIIRSMTVTKVKRGSDFHKAGILPKDVLIGFNVDVSKTKGTPESVKSQLSTIKINTPVKIYAIRDGKKMIFNTTFTSYLPAKEGDKQKRLAEFENMIDTLDRM